MKFLIYHNGDSLVIAGDTIEQVREKAYTEGAKRGWKIEDCWSEEIGEIR